MEMDRIFRKLLIFFVICGMVGLFFYGGYVQRKINEQFTARVEELNIETEELADRFGMYGEITCCDSLYFDISHNINEPNIDTITIIGTDTGGNGSD